MERSSVPSSFVFVPAISVSTRPSAVVLGSVPLSPLQLFAKELEETMSCVEKYEGEEEREEKKREEEERMRREEEERRIQEEEKKRREEERKREEERRIQEEERKRREEERKREEERRKQEEERKRREEEEKKREEEEKRKEELKRIEEETRKKEEERKLEEELKKRKEEEKRREEAKRLEEERKRKEEVELKKRKEEEQRKQNEAEESKKIAEESKKSDTIQDSDSSLFEVEEASPKPLRSPIKIDESVLQTAQDTGNARGPSGLPLFNLDRIRDMNTTEEAAEATDSETETVSDSSFVDIDQPSPPPTLLRSNSQVDASILVSQLSQMDESSESDSDEDACREGEQEVKSAAATSFLSLLKRNKEIVSGVEANAKQATANLQPAQYRAKSKRTTCWSNPKEFLINYICRREVQGSYTFQNSKQIRLHSEYSE